MRGNKKYAHSHDPIYPQYLIQRDMCKIKKILGATGTQNVGGDDELPSINPNLLNFSMTERH